MTKIQRILALVGAVSFFGSTAFATTRIFKGIWNNPQAEPTPTPTLDEQLLTQERGYLKVLEREPKNQAALEGLVNTRLQMNKLEKALETLNILIEEYPEKTEYQMVSDEIKRVMNSAEPTQPNSSSSEKQQSE